MPVVLGVPLSGILSTSKCSKLGTVSTNPVGTDFLYGKAPVLHQNVMWESLSLLKLISIKTAKTCHSKPKPWKPISAKWKTPLRWKTSIFLYLQRKNIFWFFFSKASAPRASFWCRQEVCGKFTFPSSCATEHVLVNNKLSRSVFDVFVFRKEMPWISYC